MNTATLLVELFTEELPPKALKKLGDAFASAIHQGLSKRVPSEEVRRQAHALLK